MSSIFVARQPIFELGRGLYGYELLYRHDFAVTGAEGDDGHMSAEVIAVSMLGMGLKNIAGDNVAFINFSHGQLLNESWTLFEPASVVIELLESVRCNDETLAACRRLVRDGYRLALDDFEYSEETRPLLDLASIAKIDVLHRTPAQLEAIANDIRPSGVRMLAERVETSAVRDTCAAAGYELFQGYLFSKPQTLTKTDVSPGHLAIMQLLNLIQDAGTTDDMLDAAFQSDVALSYKLLRIANAAAVGGRGITSIPHAIRLVGRATLHRWLCVLLVASLGHKGDVSHEVALTAITRARMCELLLAGSRFAPRQTGSAFIVGLLSLLDVLLEIPMDKILTRIELSAEIRTALLQRNGPLGTLLQLVEAYEKANWDAARGLAHDSALPEEALPTTYTDSLSWASVQLEAA